MKLTQPDFEGLKTRLLALLGKLNWATLTRQRRVDVVVGLTLHCLLISLQVLLVFCARASQHLLLVMYTVMIKSAALLGFVRPLRLLKDTAEVRRQLENATVVRIAGFNLVLFEGLKNCGEEHSGSSF